ncbi:hypothetical protein H4S07_007127 [Coemansia furcata]|uniref:Uncharacterized protein n=1 Tax=Coemansia furcata TaxID=417177 RepID=A0ACC1KPV4_9FUNG|nr:hypothetical protein H4S07_007127 [Coemansia furcata]
MFRSGFDDTQQPGNWTLKDIIEPGLAQFKAATKTKDASSSSRQVKRERSTVDPKKLKKKSVNKSAIVEAGSEAEKEILEALGETQTGSKRSARHRVSFSDDDDSDDDDSQSRRRGSKAKRRRADPKLLDNDADLLSSLQLYQILEMQHLGKGTPTEPSTAKTDVAAERIDNDEEVVEASGTVVSSPAMAKAKTSEPHSAIGKLAYPNECVSVSSTVEALAAAVTETREDEAADVSVAVSPVVPPAAVVQSSE